MRKGSGVQRLDIARLIERRVVMARDGAAAGLWSLGALEVAEILASNPDFPLSDEAWRMFLERMDAELSEAIENELSAPIPAHA